VIALFGQFKITEVAQIFWTTFFKVKLSIDFEKIWAIFHKQFIWSPSSTVVAPH
jgi:hypothetical protein